MDEANEDTISAFEETDAAVDLRIKNSLCLVIDFQGFFVHTKFQVREMGYITLGINTLVAMPSSNQQHSNICLTRIKRQRTLQNITYTDSLINPVTKRELMSKIKQILSY